ncbi:MAG: tetratricopeptide repeat protein [Acidobacteriota bacterium]|nr:tetratricopeptide repeat protein [Acidobacteriota bacterium]
MPPFDREGALKSADKALKQGRIDVAIAEYVKVVEAQPRDWNSANALGDLYVRANQLDIGLTQYTRIADHLATEGFYPKAAALFKKIIKLKPEDEYSLLQLADLATKQGTLADAKKLLQTVAELRNKRGDKKGAAEISVRLGTLDPEDLDARLRAAKAAADMGDKATALRELRDVAARLEKKDKAAEALEVWQAAFDIDQSDEEARARLLAACVAAGAPDRARQVARGAAELKQIAQAYEKAGKADAVLEVLGEVAALDPSDLDVRAGLALAYVSRGDLARARAYLSAETAGDHPSLWLTLAEIELLGGRTDEGRAAVVQALKLDRDQAQNAVAAGCRLAESNSEAGYQFIDAVADAALAEGDYAAAAVGLHEFTIRVPSHLVALMRLVEICVDGGLESTMYEAQAQLADAYLASGRGLEARIISEDLVAREPWNRANLDRFRRALVMLGESDPDAITADRLSGDSPFLATDKLDLNEGVSFDPAPPPAPPKAAPAAEAAAKKKKEKGAEPPAGSIELDLADALAALEAPPTPPPPTAPPPRSLDQVFRGLRDEAGRQSSEEGAAEQYQLALTYQEMGMIEDAFKALELASQSPRQRFDAASMLGRLYLDRKDTVHAIEWLERAAEAPSPTPDAGRSLLYDLAQTLEGAGESARALAVFVELESESGGFKDVAGRIDRLSKVQARG